MRSRVKAKLDGMVDNYNSGHGTTLNLSLQPSIMSTFDHSYVSGLSLALYFLNIEYMSIFKEKK